MEVCAKTDIGLCRSMNQDAILSSPTRIGCLPNLFLVADGMGGHHAGDYASSYAVKRIKEIVDQSQTDDTVLVLKTVIAVVNGELYAKGQEEEKYSGMGTTIVACSIDGDLLTVANVGDSRLYISLPDGIEQITKDHSLVAALVEKGELEKDSDAYRQKKNIITRAVGADPSVKIDVFQLNLLPQTQILLCSDGLTTMLSDKNIAEILDRDDEIEKKVQLLIDTANGKGGYDNIAVIIINPQLSISNNSEGAADNE